MSPLVLRKAHRGYSNTSCRLWDVYLELHLLPVKVQTREGKGIILFSYFSYFTISHFTIEVFNWLFNCFRLHPQVIVRFNCELVSLPCISFCLECQALLSPPPPPMISQSFFRHSIDCLWMSEYFSDIPKLWQEGEIPDWQLRNRAFPAISVNKDVPTISDSSPPGVNFWAQKMPRKNNTCYHAAIRLLPLSMVSTEELEGCEKCRVLVSDSWNAFEKNDFSGPRLI